VEIIDSAERVALDLHTYLSEENLLAGNSSKLPDEFLISDYTTSFAKAAQIFFQDQITVEHYPLWD